MCDRTIRFAVGKLDFRVFYSFQSTSLESPVCLESLYIEQGNHLLQMNSAYQTSHLS